MIQRGILAPSGMMDGRGRRGTNGLGRTCVCVCVCVCVMRVCVNHVYKQQIKPSVYHGDRNTKCCRADPRAHLFNYAISVYWLCHPFDTVLIGLGWGRVLSERKDWPVQEAYGSDAGTSNS